MPQETDQNNYIRPMRHRMREGQWPEIFIFSRESVLPIEHRKCLEITFLFFYSSKVYLEIYQEAGSLMLHYYNVIITLNSVSVRSVFAYRHIGSMSDMPETKRKYPDWNVLRAWFPTSWVVYYEQAMNISKLNTQRLEMLGKMIKFSSISN